MKLTCLSKGGGYYFPPCHMLNVDGFRVLLDCPVDLSAIAVFAPIHVDSCTMLGDEPSARSTTHKNLVFEPDENKQGKIKTPDAKGLIHAEPYYKTVNNLHLWNVSFIDVVLISSPMGILGLPFLTRIKGFSAKIYATEATAKLGQLMMEDLVAMHTEFRQFYGPEEPGFPQWMRWEELEMLPLAFKEIALGKDWTELGAWMPLYSAADVKDCMQKVQTLKYAEEACYNGTMILKAVSSGLDIGTCNWIINTPKRKVAYISSSVFESSVAKNFDYLALQGSEIVLYSDFSSGNINNNFEDDNSPSLATNDISSFSDTDGNGETTAESLVNNGEVSEEMENLAYVCSFSVRAVETGGSVLIPIGRIGIILQLLEHISFSLESSNLKVPIYIVSSVALELLEFCNIIPEWLCQQRLEKLYSGQPLFAHSELIKAKKIHLFPDIHSLKLLTIWQEPCIVFCPHWNLRLGPVTHLLRRWCMDQNSVLVIEEGVDADLALLPFKPMAMEVLQCSFRSGIRLQKVLPLLKILQPKYVVIPEHLRQCISSLSNTFSCGYYSENDTLRIPKLSSSELDIMIDLVSNLRWTKLKHQDLKISRLDGELFAEYGKHRLVPRNDRVVSSQNRPLVHWGTLDLETLSVALQKMGINGSIERGTSDTRSENTSIMHIFEPNKATIEVEASSTVICTGDENLATLISEAISSILDGF